MERRSSADCPEWTSYNSMSNINHLMQHRKLVYFPMAGGTGDTRDPSYYGLEKEINSPAEPIAVQSSRSRLSRPPFPIIYQTH